MRGRRIVHYGRGEAPLLLENMSRFNDARFLVSAAADAQFPADLGVEVAFAGRSNAGKSSAINAITQRHGLARISKTPGRTRLVNFFELMPTPAPGGPARLRLRTGACRRAQRLGAAARGAARARLAHWSVHDRGRAPRSYRGRRGPAQLGAARPCRPRAAYKGRQAQSQRSLRSAAGSVGAAVGRATAQLFSALQGTGVREAQDMLLAWLKPQVS